MLRGAFILITDITIAFNINLEIYEVYLYNFFVCAESIEPGGAVMSLKRILAVLALVLIVILLVMLLFFAFTGAKKEYILAVLFCLIVIPTVIYIFIWFTGLTKK